MGEEREAPCRTWRHAGLKVKLHLYPHRPDPADPRRSLVPFRLYHRGRVLFDGEVGVPPQQSTDGDEAVYATLMWCSLRPGDTDAEYFKDYTPRQMAFAREYGEQLMLAADEWLFCRKGGTAP